MLIALSIIAYAIAILQPEHYLPWMSWHSEVAAFLAAFLHIFSTLVFIRKNGRKNVQLTTFPLVLLVLVCIAALQYFNNQIIFFGDLFVIAIYLLTAALVMIVSFEASNASDRTSFVQADLLVIYCKVIFALALLSALLAFAQVLGVSDGSYYVLQPAQLRRPGANMGQPNHLGTLLVMGVVSLCVLNYFEKIKVILFAVALFVLSLGVVATESRTAMLSILFLGTFLLWQKKSQLGCNEQIWVFLYLIAIGMMYVAWPKILMYYQLGGAFDGSIEQTANFKVGTRLVVWPQLLHAALMHPWFGWGIREVSRAHNTVLSEYSEGEPFGYAHNIIIDSLVGIGIPLTLMLFVLSVRGIWKVYDKRHNIRNYFIIASLVPLIVHSFLEFPFAYAYFLFPGMFLIGLLSAELQSQVFFKIRLPLVFCVLSIVSAMAAWSVIEYVQIEDDFRVTRFQAANIGDVPTGWIQSNVVVLDQLAALVQVSRITPLPGMKPEEIALLKKVAQRFPWTATQNRYALALALNGNTEEAKRQLAVMRAMHGEATHTRLVDYWMHLAEKYPILRCCF